MPFSNKGGEMDLHVNKELIQLLSECDVFNELEEADLADLATMMEMKKYSTGDDLFKEGDPGGKMYIVASGAVEVQKLRSHGAGRVVIARFERGGVIGEMSLVDGMTRSATVNTVQTTKVFTLSKESFDDMIRVRKDLTIKVLLGMSKLLSLRLRNTSGWFADVF